MNKPLVSTREALIFSALEEIESVGLGRVTVRGIARRAGANVAAINYHFGSKEALIEAVLESTRLHMMNDAKAILTCGITAEAAMQGEVLAEPAKRRRWTKKLARAAVHELMVYLTEGAARYPKLTRAQMHGWFSDEETLLASDFRQLVPMLVFLVRIVTPELLEDEAERRSIQALSAVLFSTIFPGFFKEEGHTQRTAFVHTVVSTLLVGP